MAEKPENTGAGHLRSDDPLERGDDGETGTEVVPLSHGSGEGLWDTAGMRMSALCLNVLQDINDAVSLYSGDDRTLGRTKKETKQKKTKTFADFFRIKRRNKSKKSAANNAIDGKNEQTKVNSAADGENNDKEKERRKYTEEKAIAGNFGVDESGNRSSTFTPNEINISQQKKTHSTEDKTSRTKKSSKEKHKDPANADEREERQSEMMTQPLKQNETRKQKKVKQKSSNAKDLAVERSKAEDILGTSLNGKTEDILETKSNGKTEDIIEIPLNGKTEDILEIPSTGKTEDVLEISLNDKTDVIMEIPTNGKTEDILEIPSTGKTEDITEIPLNGKIENTLEIPSNGKTEDILEIPLKGKTEDITEIPLNGKNDDIPETKSTGKAEDIIEIKSTGKTEDIPETKSTGKAEDIPEIKSTGKTEDITEIKSTGKTEDIPETKSTGKAEDILEIKSTGKTENVPETKSTGKTEDIPETKSTGKTEDVLETKSTGKTNNVLRIPFTGKSEHGLERSNRRESSDGKDDRGEGRGDGNRGRGLLTRVEDITGADDRRSTTNSKQTDDASICSQESSNTIPRGRSRNRNEDEKLRRGRSEDPAAAKGQSAKRSGKRRRRALSREWVMVRTTTTEYTTTTTASNRNAKTNDDDSQRQSPSNAPNKKDKETEELLYPKIHQKDNKAALQGHDHRQLPSEVNDSKDLSELLNKDVGKSFSPLLTKIRIERNQDNAPENLGSAPPPLTPLQNSSLADSNHLSMAQSESLQGNSDTLQSKIETFASSAEELTGDRRPFQSDSFDFDDHDQAKETSSENLSDTTKAFRHNADSFSKATEARSIKDSGVTSTEINFHGTALGENSPETKSRLRGNEKRNWLKPQTTSSTDSSDIDRTTTNHQLPDDRKTDRPRHSDETEISRTAKASKRNRTRETPTLKHSSSSSSSSSSPLHSTTTTDIIGQSRGGGGNGGLSPSEGSIWPTAAAAADDSPFVDEVRSNDRSADDASDSGPLRLDGGEGGGQTTNRPTDGLEETKSRSSAAAKDGFVFSPEPESEEEDRRSVSSHSKTQMSCSAVEANASAFERCPESNGTGVEEREPMSPGDENQEKQNEGQSKEKINAFVINDISTDIFIARQSDVDSGNLRYRNSAESNVFSQSSCPKTSSDSLPRDISTASLKNETPAHSSEDIVSCGVTVQGDERSTETTNRPFDSENAEEKKHSTDCRRGSRETSSSTEFMTGKTSTEDPMSGSVDEGYGSVKKTSKRKNCGKQKAGDRAVKREDKRRREKVNSGIISSLIATSDRTDSESRSTENESYSLSSNSMTPNTFSESIKPQESISKEEDNISVTRFVVEHSESLGSTSEGVKGLRESGYDTSHATVVGCCLWTGDSVARSADEYGCKGKDRPEENIHFTPDPQHVHSSSCLRVEGSPLHQTEQHETVREGGEKYQQRTFEGPTKQRSDDEDDDQPRRRRGSPGHIEDEDDEVTTTSEDRTNRRQDNSSSSSRVHHQTITGRSVLSYFFVSIAGLLSIVLLIYIVYIM